MVMMEGQQPPVVAVRGLAYSSKAGQDEEEEEEDAAVLVFEDDSDWVSGEGWLGCAAKVYACIPLPRIARVCAYMPTTDLRTDICLYGRVER